MTDRDASLHTRLARLFGMSFDAEHLRRADRLLDAYGIDHGRISDIVLMTVCVEAYRTEDTAAPIWT